MAGYDGVLGIDEAAITDFLTAAFTATRDTVFRGTLAVADRHLGRLEWVDYDVASAPVVTVLPSSGPSRVVATSTATVALRVDALTVTLRYAAPAPPTTLRGSLAAVVGLAADADGMLTPQLGTVTLTLPEEETLSEILGNVLVPFVERILQTQVLPAIRIAPPAAGQIHLAGPVLESGGGRILVTAALDPGPAAAAPLSWTWPTGQPFLAVDFALVNTLVARHVDAVEPFVDTWSKTFKVGPIQSTLKVDYTAVVTRVVLGAVPGAPGRVAGTADVALDLHAHAKSLGSVSGTGTATVGVACHAEFADGNVVAVRLDGLDDFTPRIDIHNCPGWLDRNLSDFARAVATAFRPAISAQLAVMAPIPVGQLPSFGMTVRGVPLVVDVARPTLTTAGGPDGRALLIATGVPGVHGA